MLDDFPGRWWGDDVYHPYPDNDAYCPECGDVLSLIDDNQGREWEMCNHCGYKTGLIVVAQPTEEVGTNE